MHTATLMSDGKIIVAGGLEVGNTFAQNITLVDPVAGTASGAGVLQTPRYGHTAVLLQNGKVLIVGGYGGTGIFNEGLVNTPELYDRATSICRSTTTMPDPVQYHSTVLLTNGDVLLTGGTALNGPPAIQSVYDTGLDYNSAWGPQITNFASTVDFGLNFGASGTQFRGIGEGSSGYSQTSPSDHPVVQLRRLENGQTIVMPLSFWTPTLFSSGWLTNFSPGLAMATMFVNGIPSPSLMVNMVKGSVVITISNLVQTYDGTAKSVSVTTSPTGFVPVVTYNGSTSPPTNAGNYTVVATVNTLNYAGSRTNTLQIVPVSVRNFGVDVSHYQDASGIPETNWVQMYQGGIRFVFAKATEGLTGPDDPTMVTNVAGASQAGLLVGVYHFGHPENRPTTNGAVQEADHLLTYAGSAIGPGMLRPVLDLETTSGSLPPSAYTDWVIAFAQEIIAHRGAGAAPIIYCSQGFANYEFDTRLAGYSLWMAAGGGDPGTGQPGTNGFPSVTGVFTNWSFWQYNVGSAGGISPIDLDVCQDEIAPLASYLIPSAAAGFTIRSDFSDSSGFHMSFTNAPGTHFTLLSTTNVSLAVSNWTVVGAFTEVSPGQFQIVDSGGTNHPFNFYRVRSP